MAWRLGPGLVADAATAASVFRDAGARMPQSMLKAAAFGVIVGSEGWCGREDSNFHGVSPTATSTLRVYQFRHDRVRAPM